MKLLILGNIESPFVYFFSKSLKKIDPDIQIDILSYGKQRYNSKGIFHDIEIFKRIAYPNIKFGNTIEKIPILRGLMRRFVQKQIFKSFKQSIYDNILIHSLTTSNIENYKKISPKSPRLFLAFWGSDFYNASEKTLSDIQELANQAIAINIQTPEFQHNIQQKLRIDNAKISNCKFGLEPMENIAELIKEPNNSTSKLFFELSEEDIIITIGYNANPIQQHLLIIEEINKLSDELLEKLTFVFPIGYGGDEMYKNRISKALQQSKFQYKILDKFLNSKDVAILRCATDIFIQLQKTDALSGSMQEHLFAKNIVITGSWLHYNSFKEKGIYFEEINHVNEVREKLESIITNFHDFKQKTNVNGNEKFEESFWDFQIKCWHNFLVQ